MGRSSGKDQLLGGMFLSGIFVMVIYLFYDIYRLAVWLIAKFW